MAAITESAADVRAREIEQQMTDDERFSLIISIMGYIPGSAVGGRDARLPENLTNMSAGYTPGIPRLGIPAIQSSDASMGVTNPGYRPDDPGATAFPSLIALGSSFNPQLVREGGEAIAREARSRGLNVQLAGGCNLMRDPRNGRNFEYFSEDPYLTAVLAAEQVNGIQSQGVVSTLKHYTLNCNETNRHWLDAIIDPDAHRESDLLAFQIAIERSQPGSIMSGYNKINGEYAGGNHHLLNDVLKGAWGYKGWVMSDWGATPEWNFALAGLDQESGIQADVLLWGSEAFTEDLRNAYANGELPSERLSDMVRRILRSLFAVGADAWEPAPPVDMARHHEIALEGARQGIVLLKNDGALPLPTDKPLKIAVIGGYAQQGIVSGTGSGAVAPVGGFASVIKIGGAGVMGKHRNLFLFPPSPLEELQAALPQAQFDFDPGYTPSEAALTATCRFRGARMPSSTPSPRSTRTRSSFWRPATRSRCRGATRSVRSSRRGIRGRPAREQSQRCSLARSTRRAGCRSPSRPASTRRRARSFPASGRRGGRPSRSSTTRAPRSAIAGSRRPARNRSTRSATA
jgi:beta-glucosidase